MPIKAMERFVFNKSLFNAAFLVVKRFFKRLRVIINNLYDNIIKTHYRATHRVQLIVFSVTCKTHF